VAGVGVVTASQGNLFWLYGPPSRACAPTPTCFCGTGPALGKPYEHAVGPHHWYNFSVQSAGGGLEWGEILLQVVTATNANVTPTASWTGTVTVPSAGPPVATYEFTNGTWVTGASVLWTSVQTLSLDSSTTNLSAMGDTLNVNGVGCFQGSISVSIP
jgi:hypothetical protein